jgi:hypothetical protein
MIEDQIKIIVKNLIEDQIKINLLKKMIEDQDQDQIIYHFLPPIAKSPVEGHFLNFLIRHF